MTHYTYKTIYIVSAALVLALVFLGSRLVRADSIIQRDQPTVRFVTPDGRSNGSATTDSQGTTRVYDPRGNHIGTTMPAGDPRLDPRRK